MLDFRIVDPAMGSGHFLVDALDATADWLARFLSDNPRLSVKPIEQARDQITAIGKEYGIESLGEGIGDFELLRRNVMRSCIYGVDLEPNGCGARETRPLAACVRPRIAALISRAQP